MKPADVMLAELGTLARYRIPATPLDLDQLQRSSPPNYLIQPLTPDQRLPTEGFTGLALAERLLLRVARDLDEDDELDDEDDDFGDEDEDFDEMDDDEFADEEDDDFDDDLDDDDA